MTAKIDDKIRQQLHKPNLFIIDRVACEIHKKVYSWQDYLYIFEFFIPSGKAKETPRINCVCCKKLHTACDCSFLGKTEKDMFLMQLEGYKT